MTLRIEVALDEFQPFLSFLTAPHSHGISPVKLIIKVEHV